MRDDDASLQDLLPTPATTKRTRKTRSKSVHTRPVGPIEFQGPSANTRSRANSQASGQGSLPGSYNDTDNETDELINEIETPTGSKSKGKDPASERILDFTKHPFCFAGKHPTPARFSNSSEFAQVITNPQQCKEWYDLLVNIIEFDHKTLEGYKKVSKEHDETVTKFDQLKRKYHQKKNLIDAQSQAHVKISQDLQIAQEDLASAKIQRDQALQEVEDLQRETTEIPVHQAEQGIFSDTAPYQNLSEPTAESLTKESVTKESVTKESVTSWRPRGTHPSKSLNGKNKDDYAAWAFTVKRKVETDSPIYTTDAAKIDYALSKMTDPIFDVMLTWVQDQSNPIWTDFFEEIEHYLGLHMQVTEAKHLLHSIKMKNDESIDEYYHRIYKLWQRAKTPEDERIRQFIITIKPNLSAPLVSKTFLRMRDLLDKARTIEDRKKEITYTHFDKNQQGNKGGPRNGNPNGDNNRNNNRSNNNPPGNTNSSANTTTPKPEQSKNTPNWKFMPCKVRPDGWVGKWHKPEEYPKRANPEEKEELTRTGRCWGCRGSGHRTGDTIDGKPVCPKYEKRMNTQAIEESSSESESESEKGKV